MITQYFSLYCSLFVCIFKFIVLRKLYDLCFQICCEEASAYTSSNETNLAYSNLFVFIISMIFVSKSSNSCTVMFLYFFINVKQSHFSETRTCLKFKKVAFVGDSRMRGLFYQLAGSLSGRNMEFDNPVCMLAC